MQNCLHIHPSDNAAVALHDLKAGTSCLVSGSTITLVEDIPSKHKFALTDLKVNDPLVLYGIQVGTCVQAISRGGVITTENLVHSTSDYEIRARDTRWQPPDISRWEGATFLGYHRKDGSVGTANYWLVVPLVFCENRNLEVIAEALTESLGYPSKKDYRVDTSVLVENFHRGASETELMDLSIIHGQHEWQDRRIFKNVDGIKFLRHEGGCGGTREDSQMLCKLLAGYITHPNVGGATILSLGCQHAQVSMLKEAIASKDPDFDKPVFYLEQQQSKNERDFISQAVKCTFVGLTKADKSIRRPAPLKHLVLGLECGGSDGFSGISANPALGYCSDLLVALGGTAVLSEFPELHGVEQELIHRCATQQLAEKFAGLMSTYSLKAQAVGSGFESNPSPGNIRDGLITDAMKSAGAAKKGGTSPVKDVLDYGETAHTPGLNLLCTPGNDVESTTGLAGAGANVIVFTTGLGTPTGNPIAPVIKVSTNSSLFQRMPDIIDFDAGTILSGQHSIQEKGAELMDYIIRVASGQKVPAAVRLVQNDFIPWKRGVSL